MARIYMTGMAQLEAWRSQFIATGAAYEPVKSIVGNAEWALKQPFPTVVDTGPHQAPSNDPHDYVSFHRFYWPNPDTEDGLPYIYKDGESNPVWLEYPDRPAIDNLYRIVPKLATGYYVTRHAAYATAGINAIRTWFINAATFMRPHMKYAMHIPGVTDGSYSGIMESRGIADVTDAIGILEMSPAWKTSDRDGIGQWMNSFLSWLTNSYNGIKERDAPNNHSTWYDTQVLEYALFLGQNQSALNTIQRVKTKRIGAQIEPTGRQPQEVTRSQSLTYSFFNLEAFTVLAAQAKNSGKGELWNYVSWDGRSIRNAIDYLLPYIKLQEAWPYQQIGAVDRNPVRRVLNRAAEAYQDSKYTDALIVFESSSL